MNVAGYAPDAPVKAWSQPDQQRLLGRIVRDTICRQHENCAYWLVRLEKPDTPSWTVTYHQPDLQLQETHQRDAKVMAYFPPQTVKVPGVIIEWGGPCNHHGECGYWVVELPDHNHWVSTYHQPDLDLIPPDGTHEPGR